MADKINIRKLEAEQGVMPVPACGPGGMFVQTGDFVNDAAELQRTEHAANTRMTFYGQEKRTITRQQCLALNDMASAISNEPWTQELEQALLSS